MAVPFINLFANTMGGIGPIELSDLSRLGDLTQQTGVPFYAGRFYPKNTADEWNLLNPGFFSQTPPFIGWKDFGDTQIWMVPAFEDERILTMNCEVTHISLWPRSAEEEETQGEFTPTGYDYAMQGGGWELSGPDDSIDPGVIVTNDVVPPLLFAGYVGISELSGSVTEYGWYDQEMVIVNNTKYGQDHIAINAKNYRFSLGFVDAEEEIDFLQNFNPDTYQEILRVRTDGVWKKVGFNIADSTFDITSEEYTSPTSGLPYKGFQQISTSGSADLRSSWINNTHSSVQYASEGTPVQRERTEKTVLTGDDNIPYTKYEAGIVQQFVPSRLNTLCYTIKVSCTTGIVPDTIPADTATALGDLAAGALETLGSNLSNNIWYFYMPVLYNGDYLGERIDELTSRGGINNTDFEDL